MPQYSPYPSQLALPEQCRRIYTEHNYTYDSVPPPPPPLSYNYTCDDYYRYYQYPYQYSPYQYQSRPQLDLGTKSSDFMPTVQYSNKRTYVRFSYPEPVSKFFYFIRIYICMLIQRSTISFIVSIKIQELYIISDLKLRKKKSDII